MKLWCFLHAFQNSPYRYFHLPVILEALLASAPSPGSWEIFFDRLRELSSGEPWWHELIAATELLEEQEKSYFDPSIQRFTFFGDHDYPQAFSQSANPPLALSYEGCLADFDRPCLSAVGSRDPHEFTRSWIQRDLYEFLKQTPVPIISGGARGVDQMVHRLALLMNLPTMVFLPSGLSRKYPQLWQETQWRERPVTFVSEFPLGAPISKQNFSSRNRLIAAASPMTLILEARAKSGTLITAHHSLIEGKVLGVVPGHPHLSHFSGSLELLSEGGCLVRNASDLSFYFSGDLQHETGRMLSLDQSAQKSPYP
ncbi:MAG: DNA-processing protein DprA [Bdellovibrionales bacterium]